MAVVPEKDHLFRGSRCARPHAQSCRWESQQEGGYDAHVSKGEEDQLPTLSRFEVRRRLGAGGMGEVFEAFDRQQGTVVALKLLRRVSPRALARLKSEFRSVVEVRDRNLVRLREMGVDGDEWFITMELVDGVDFLSYVRLEEDA